METVIGVLILVAVVAGVVYVSKKKPKPTGAGGSFPRPGNQIEK